MAGFCMVGGRDGLDRHGLSLMCSLKVKNDLGVWEIQRTLEVCLAFGFCASLLAVP